MTFELEKLRNMFIFECNCCYSGMSLGVPMAPAAGGTNIGMSTVPGMGIDPSAAAGLGMTAGLGLGATPGLAPDATAMMGLGSAATATAAAAAPPIATECLLVSNMFDPNKLASFHHLLTSFAS